MSYWWASQGKNHQTAIAQGTLWSLPRKNGVVPTDRALLRDMRLGDTVFHYDGPYLRAVSTVIEEWKSAPRPDGYPRKEDEGNDGWMVRVAPAMQGLDLHWHRVAELISLGSPGPFNATGSPQQKYISRLSDAEGEGLLREIGMSRPDDQKSSLLGRPSEHWGAEETDGLSLSTIRLEQGHLRRHLLGGRGEAPCAICGQKMPARVLIAGHIKPRSKCTADERKDFTSAAMLICALGCDALFEWGYVIVDDGGIVRRGLTAETTDLRDNVDLVIGKRCLAHNEKTAPNFKEHVRLVGMD